RTSFPPRRSDDKHLTSWKLTGDVRRSPKPDLRRFRRNVQTFAGVQLPLSERLWALIPCAHWLLGRQVKRRDFIKLLAGSGLVKRGLAGGRHETRNQPQPQNLKRPSRPSRW